MQAQNRFHDSCEFNRITFKNNGYCENCCISSKLDEFQRQMDELSVISKELIKDANYDYLMR